jgi:16S rRNA (cytidine1402-2'-O)-methyltransferase
MPSVSDPGYRLVAACVEQGIAIDVAPGPSAAVAALVISGLPTDRWVFEGFLPRSSRARDERIQALVAEQRTTVLFESPKRVVTSLEALREVAGGRRVAVCRELTKLHQEVIRGNVDEVLQDVQGRDLKGEVVIVLEGARTQTGSLEEAVRIAAHLVAEGSKKRDAAKEAAIRTGIASGRIYAALLEDRLDADPV